MSGKSVFDIASAGLAKVPENWMPATGVRSLVFNDPVLVWLDYHGEANGFKKDSSPYEFTKFIFEKGREFERKWIAEMASEAIRICEEPFNVRDVEKFRETLKCMEQRVPLIAAPALWWAPEKVYGVPDLLVHSKWLRDIFSELQTQDVPTDCYVVFDMKFTTKLDSSQKKTALTNYSAQTRIYSYIVGQLIEIMAPQAFIICRDRITDPLGVRIHSATGTPLDKDLSALRDKHLDIKLNGHKYLTGINKEIEINLTNDQDAPWHTAKLEIAHNNVPGGDTCLVYEIGVKQKEDLANHGFPNRESLLKTNPVKIPLELCHGLGAAKCPRIRSVLQANQSGEITPKSISRIPNQKKFEFYVDFETFNNVNVNFDKEWPALEGCEMIFMIGVGWDENGQWKFQVFISEEESHAHELKMLMQFHDFLHSKTNGEFMNSESTVLYHWTSAEVWQLRRSAERHNLDAEHTLRNLPWYDLQKEVFLAEPIGVPGAWGYSLKKVAKALNLVEWPGNLDDGLRATVAGWKAYQTTTPIASDEMKTIVPYNEVDCKALFEIVNWLRR